MSEEYLQVSKGKVHASVHLDLSCSSQMIQLNVFNLQVLSGGRLSCDTVIGPLVQLLYDSSTSVQVVLILQNLQYFCFSSGPVKL
jgi:hypothetical protein